MVLVCIRKCLEGEKTILTALVWGSAKLKLRSMEFEEAEGMTIHYGGQDFTADVHQHYTTPFIGIRKIA